MKIGSLCSGYEGLGAAVQSVLGGDLAWFAEIDPDASKVLAHHWPDVANLGDLTKVDWATVEPVDVVAAGFPCQPVSAAGRRHGLDDERWLFDDICTALGRMVTRPRLLVFENVPGLLTANGGRAMAHVVHGLAALGYVGSWRTVRASDIGAPHRRERWFCVAADASAPGRRPPGTRLARCGAAAPGRGPEESGRRDLRAPVADTDDQRGERCRALVDRLPESADSGATVTHSCGAGLEDRHVESDRHERPAAERSGVPAATDAPGDGRHEGRPEPARLVRGPDAPLGGDAPAHAGGAGLGEHPGGPPAEEARQDAGHVVAGDLGARADLDWGPYRPAIERWERILGRPAPVPTEPGRRGQPRLSPVFVEFLMGLPAGHVTAVPGISRNAQLRILGNGIVPAQAAYALRLLLDLGEVAA